MTTTSGTNGSSFEVDESDESDPATMTDDEADATDETTDAAEGELGTDDEATGTDDIHTDDILTDGEFHIDGDVTDGEFHIDGNGADTSVDEDDGQDIEVDDDVEVSDEADTDNTDNEPDDELDPDDEPDAIDDEFSGAAGMVDSAATDTDDSVAGHTPDVAAMSEAPAEPDADGPPDPPLAPIGPPAAVAGDWTTGQLRSVVSRALAIGLALTLIGFGLGLTRGGTSVARAEFVYTLDQSVPDSFLREDRRLLTQVATFTSDAVLAPVAQRFDLDVDDLRDSISIETVALSEVLRLEVTDPDPGRALAINRAVLDQYLEIITAAAPAGDSVELARQRAAVVTALAEVDGRRHELATTAAEDAVLAVRQDSIQRQIDLTRDRTAALQGLVDDTIFTSLGTSRTARLNDELEASRAQLVALEAELTGLVGERAELATATTAEPALQREVERLEGRLSTIDEELSQRELGPLVASPIRELSEPTVIERPATRAGVQGAAIGALVALPLAAWVAYRTRRRQLWFG